MTSKMDVSVLVTQMHETLSTIHDTIAFLSATGHDERLDELERRRDSTIQSLIAAFSAESESLNQKRKLEREEIAERRRIEDEERERRRRAEDEELLARDRRQDEERDGKLQEETKDIEEETDALMTQVEEEAEKVVEDSMQRLKALEEKRRELNRLIDEQLQMPLPAISARARRGTRTSSFMRPVVSAESKPLPFVPADAPLSNVGVKAPEDGQRQLSKAIGEPDVTSSEPSAALEPVPQAVDVSEEHSPRSMAKDDSEPSANVTQHDASLADESSDKSSDEEVEPAGDDEELDSLHEQPATTEKAPEPSMQPAERYHSDDEAHHIVSSPEHLPRNFASPETGSYGQGDLEVGPLNISKRSSIHETPEAEPVEKEVALTKEVDRAVSHLSEAASIISTHEFESTLEPKTHEIDDDVASVDGILGHEDKLVGGEASGPVEHLYEVDSDSDVEDERHGVHDTGSDYNDRAQHWPLPEETQHAMPDRQEEPVTPAQALEETHFAGDQTNSVVDHTDSERLNEPHLSSDERPMQHEVGLGITHDEAVQHGHEHWDSSHDSEEEVLDEYLKADESRELDSDQAGPASTTTGLDQEPGEKTDVTVQEHRHGRFDSAHEAEPEVLDEPLEKHRSQEMLGSTQADDAGNAGMAMEPDQDPAEWTHVDDRDHRHEQYGSADDSEAEVLDEPLAKHSSQDVVDSTHAGLAVLRDPEQVEEDSVDSRDHRHSVSSSEEDANLAEAAGVGDTVRIDMTDAPPHPDDYFGSQAALPSPKMDNVELARENVMQQEHGESLIHEAADDTPAIPTYLAPGESAADSDSQGFFTPLPSTSIRSPAPAEQRTLADELDHADDDSDYFGDGHEEHQNSGYGQAQLHEDHAALANDDPYAQSSHGHYQHEDEEEHTTTVQGQDTLFDYDDHSVGSSAARSESPGLEHHSLGDERGSGEAPATEMVTTDQAFPVTPRAPGFTHDAGHTNESVEAADDEYDPFRHDRFDEADSSVHQSSSPQASPTTPPLQSSQTPPTDISQFSQFELQGTPSSVSSSPLAKRGLAASRHNPERPEAPVNGSPEYASHESEHMTPRDVTNVPWQERSASMTRSLHSHSHSHSQSTISSAPSSPAHHHSLDNHDPAIRHSWQTSSNPFYAGRPRGDSAMTDNSVTRFDMANKDVPPPMPQWQAQESFTPGPPVEELHDESHRENTLNVDTSASAQHSVPSPVGSLFQRMRSVFENSAQSTTQRPLSFSKSSGSNRNSQFAAHNEEDDDSDEHSSLLNHQAGTRTSVN